MASLNLYISDTAEPIFERLKKMLEKEGRSISEFVAEAAENYVNYHQSEPEDIELEGPGPKRIFKGKILYWEEQGSNELGVFLTAKGKVAFWRLRATALDDDETFEVYEDLNELWEEQDLKNRIKTQVQKEYVALTNKAIVERLDI